MMSKFKVLDIGCAAGYIVARLRKVGVEAYGIDISNYILSQAPDEVKPYLKQGSVDNLPWPDQYFDMVVTFSVLEHLGPAILPKAISEIKRVASRGIIAVTPGDDPYFDNDITHRTKQPLSWWRTQFPPGFEVLNDADEEFRARAKIPEVYIHDTKKANKGGSMKILVICTTVFDLPPKGYSGLEWLVSEWAKYFRDAGHQVSVVCPGGSNLGEGIEIISTGLREPEDAAYLKYKNRLESGEFDAVLDNSWGWFSVLSQMEADHQLPIIHIYHSDAANLGTPPPVQYPCLVALSKSQAELISMKWNTVCRVNYNGIDLSFYKTDSEVERGSRYLFMGRYTPEKAPLEAIFLAKKCRVPLDLYGDVEIIASQDYLTKVVNECDNRQIVFHPGVSREETVKLYQNHKALIHLVNYNEAFGLVPVECMACGTPVIVNRRGALPELVKHGKSGFVVDSLEEAEELIKSDAVSKLKTEDIVKQGKKFSIEKSAKGHLRLLSDVANNIYW